MIEITKEILTDAKIYLENAINFALAVGDEMGSRIHIMVNTDYPGLVVPAVVPSHPNDVSVEDAKEPVTLNVAILNVASRAVTNRAIVMDRESGEGTLFFKARFNTVPHELQVPLGAILGVNFPDAIVPPVILPNALLMQWLAERDSPRPARAVVESSDNVVPIGAPKKARPTLTVVK